MDYWQKNSTAHHKHTNVRVIKNAFEQQWNHKNCTVASQTWGGFHNLPYILKGPFINLLSRRSGMANFIDS